MIDSLKKQATELKNTITNTDTFKKAEKRYDDIDEKVRTNIKLEVNNEVMNYAKKVMGKVKEEAKDEQMYKPIQNIIDDTVENITDFALDSLQQELNLKMMLPYVKLEQTGDLSCCQKLRAFHNYSLMPYDKTTGETIKQTWWKIFQLLQIFPFGIQQLYFFFNFLCIDKGDEFQLIYFILNFKKNQFLCLGIITGVLEYVQLYTCLLFNSQQVQPTQSEVKCQILNQDILVKIEVSLFLFNVLLVWLCGLLLPTSSKKGEISYKTLDKQQENIQNSQQQNELPNQRDSHVVSMNETQLTQKEEQHQGKCAQFLNFDRGGRLKYLVIWDLIIFGGCVLWFLHVLQIKGIKNLAETGHDVIFCKWVYGMCSVPWVIFNIPLLTQIISKAKPTYYDQLGNCRPYNFEKKIKKDDKQIEAQRSNEGAQSQYLANSQNKKQSSAYQQLEEEKE